MQLTVLIEFLVPGVAMVLLVLALLPGGALPDVPSGLPSGETVTALLLLAIAYPVGILINVPVFWFQQYCLLPRARRKIFERYGSELLAIVQGRSSDNDGPPSDELLGNAFERLHAVVFARNIDRLNAHRLFHQSLQRLSRGITIPLVLAMGWVLCDLDAGWARLVSALGVLLALSLWLLNYSVQSDEMRIATYYVQLEPDNQPAAPSRSDDAPPPECGDR